MLQPLCLFLFWLVLFRFFQQVILVCRVFPYRILFPHQIFFPSLLYLQHLFFHLPTYREVLSNLPFLIHFFLKVLSKHLQWFFSIHHRMNFHHPFLNLHQTHLHWIHPFLNLHQIHHHLPHHPLYHRLMYHHLISFRFYRVMIFPYRYHQNLRFLLLYFLHRHHHHHLQKHPLVIYL